MKAYLYIDIEKRKYKFGFLRRLALYVALWHDIWQCQRHDRFWVNVTSKHQIKFEGNCTQKTSDSPLFNFGAQMADADPKAIVRKIYEDLALIRDWICL